MVTGNRKAAIGFGTPLAMLQLNDMVFRARRRLGWFDEFKTTCRYG